MPLALEVPALCGGPVDAPPGAQARAHLKAEGRRPSGAPGRSHRNPLCLEGAGEKAAGRLRACGVPRRPPRRLRREATQPRAAPGPGPRQPRAAPAQGAERAASCARARGHRRSVPSGPRPRRKHWSRGASGEADGHRHRQGHRDNADGQAARPPGGEEEEASNRRCGAIVQRSTPDPRHCGCHRFGLERVAIASPTIPRMRNILTEWVSGQIRDSPNKSNEPGSQRTSWKTCEHGNRQKACAWKAAGCGWAWVCGVGQHGGRGDYPESYAQVVSNPISVKRVARARTATEASMIRATASACAPERS